MNQCWLCSRVPVVLTQILHTVLRQQLLQLPPQPSWLTPVLYPNPPHACTDTSAARFLLLEERMSFCSFSLAASIMRTCEAAAAAQHSKGQSSKTKHKSAQHKARCSAVMHV